MVAQSGACDESSGSVENGLQATNDVDGDSVKNGVAVVNSTNYERLDDRTQGVECHRLSHGTQLTQMVEAGACNNVDVLFHR